MGIEISGTIFQFTDTDENFLINHRTRLSNLDLMQQALTVVEQKLYVNKNFAKLC